MKNTILGYGNVKQCKTKGGNCVKCVSSVPTGKIYHYSTKIHVKIHIKTKHYPHILQTRQQHEPMGYA